MNGYSETAKNRANQIINRYQGNADEFCMLKGVLCITHGMKPRDAQQARKLIDFSLIAERMDVLQKEAIQSNPFKTAAFEPFTPAQIERSQGQVWLK